MQVTTTPTAAAKPRYSTTPNRDPKKKETPVMNVRISTLLKLLVCGLLVLLAADLQAQLIFKTKFSAVEGYTNGWIIGQPTAGVTKWANANAFFEQDIGNCNDGHSWWPAQDKIPGLARRAVGHLDRSECRRSGE